MLKFHRSFHVAGWPCFFLSVGIRQAVKENKYTYPTKRTNTDKNNKTLNFNKFQTFFITFSLAFIYCRNNLIRISCVSWEHVFIGYNFSYTHQIIDDNLSLPLRFSLISVKKDHNRFSSELTICDIRRHQFWKWVTCQCAMSHMRRLDSFSFV